MSARPLRILASVTATFALVAGGVAATTSTAHAAVGDDFCPDAYDTNTLTEGQAVTGLTTVKGTTPQEFHGTYVGTIENGIAPGLDLPVFDMEDSRITFPDGKVDAGIWAGMSGSPVYDDATGDLIGAVSYGFSSVPSRRAGVTPATYMYDLDSTVATSLAAPRTTVKASRSEAATIASASEDGAVSGAYHLLKASKQVSGDAASVANKNAAKSKLLAKKKSKSGGFRAGGSARSADTHYPITPGGNIATTFSTGDVTTAAVGTATAICDGKVFAFGHPDEFTGKSTETFNGASTVFIQEDAVAQSSYKIANIGAVEGVINQDRIAGIMGTLGQRPVNAQVVTHGSAAGDSRESTTDVSVPEALSYVVATQVSNDALVLLDQNSSGDALMTWKISYTRKIGGVDTPKVLQRTERTSTDTYFLEEIGYEAASDVESLLANEFAKVKITKVDITSTFLPDYRAFKPHGAQYFTGGVWKNVYASSTIKVRPGSMLKLRVKLAPANAFTDVAPTTVDYRVRTSTSAHGTGSVNLTGQAPDRNEYDEFEEFEEFFGFDDEEEEGPASLDELIAMIKAQPRADDILSRLRFKGAHSTNDKFTLVRAPGMVHGSFGFKVAFTK